MVPAALAGSGDPPVFNQSGGNTKPAVNYEHGLSLSIRLKGDPSDGGLVPFEASVRNHNKYALHYVSTAVVWHFGGSSKMWTAELSDLADMRYVGKDRSWLRLATLNPGIKKTLNGNIKVPERDNSRWDGKNAEFFCVRLYVRVSFPLNPSANWWVHSKPSCYQYSVQ
jgi:hypothetical protein